MNNQEIEIKLWVTDIIPLERKLLEMGAERVQPRIQELNLRYDTPDRTLTKAGQALRLRKDSEARLTFKGPGVIQSGAYSRKEIEFVVPSFEAADEFLLALGYQVSFIYEKYRAVFQFDEISIMMDELPYGKFIEIEAANPEEIRKMVKLLDLSWEARITESYMVLFDRLKRTLSLPFRDLTFQNFTGYQTSVEILGIQAADIQAEP